VAHYLFNFSKKGGTKGKTLREQAGNLLSEGLWGIGGKTPHRSALSEDDLVLIYVGAPEQAFVGAARVSSSVHEWTPEEKSRYPQEGTFTEGVALDSATLWSHPVPIQTVLPSLTFYETNPKAQFRSGVVRIAESDYEAIVAAATGKTPKATVATQPQQEDAAVDLFHVAEQLRSALAKGLTLSEYDTRAFFIDKSLSALGYREIEDIQHGVPVESGNFADYVLKVKGKPVIVVEAKKLGSELKSKDAAQLVQYCATLGVRWGVLTNGSRFEVYDAPVLDVPPHERLIFAVDLTEFSDETDFDARVYPELSLIAKGEMESGGGLERRVAQEAVREILTSGESKSLSILRKELKQKKAIELSAQETADLVSELMS
jgi:predicted type IV restriction endonuclease